MLQRATISTWNLLWNIPSSLLSNFIIFARNCLLESEERLLWRLSVSFFKENFQSKHISVPLSSQWCDEIIFIAFINSAYSKISLESCAFSRNGPISFSALISMSSLENEKTEQFFMVLPWKTGWEVSDFCGREFSSKSFVALKSTTSK